MQIDDLDEYLERGDPAARLTTQEQHLVATMVDQSVPPRRSRRARPVVAVTAAVVVLGGAGLAAAAATGDRWSPWAQDDVLAVLSYERPSGESCELRLGNVGGAPAAVRDVIRDVLLEPRLDDAAVVAEAARVLPGRDPLTDDHAYDTGVAYAVQARIDDALATHGLDGQWESYESEVICS